VVRGFAINRFTRIVTVKQLQLYTPSILKLLSPEWRKYVSGKTGIPASLGCKKVLNDWAGLSKTDPIQMSSQGIP
jgi:hypothetical protein